MPTYFNNVCDNICIYLHLWNYLLIYGKELDTQFMARNLTLKILIFRLTIKEYQKLNTHRIVINPKNLQPLLTTPTFWKY